MNEMKGSMPNRVLKYFVGENFLQKGFPHTPFKDFKFLRRPPFYGGLLRKNYKFLERV